MITSVKLGDVAEEITVGHVGAMASEYVADGIPFLRSLNIQPYRIITNDLRHISEEFHRRLKKSALRPDDVVIVRTGKPGICAVIPEWLPEANCSDLVIVRCGKAIRPRFLAYWVNALATHHIDSNLVGAVQQHFNVGSARELPILLPSPDLQDEILSILGSLDDKIELNRRLNETLEAMAQAIFRDWFVDFGPTRRKLAGITDPVEIMGGLTTDPARAAEFAPWLPAALTEDGLPVGWSRRPFAAFVDVISGGTPKTTVSTYWGGDIPWFSVVDTPPNGDVFVRSTEKSITAEGLAESAARLVPPETTIISARGTVGNLAIAAREMAFNQSCYALRAQTPVGNYFVYLVARRLVDQLKSMAHGSVFSTITRDTFERVDFPYPGHEALAQFEGIVGVLFTKIKSNGAECETLAATRDLLLPKLMSGEIRLRDAENAVAEVRA